MGKKKQKQVQLLQRKNSKKTIQLKSESKTGKTLTNQIDNNSLVSLVDPHRPTGLINNGNTCYYNATLQALACTRRYLPINLTSQTIYGNITNLYLQLLIKMRNNPSVKPIDPSNLLTMISSKNKQFKGYRQQDSHELILTLLNLLDDEYIKYLRDNDIDNDKENVVTKEIIQDFNEDKIELTEIMVDPNINQSENTVSDNQVDSNTDWSKYREIDFTIDSKEYEENKKIDNTISISSGIITPPTVNNSSGICTPITIDNQTIIMNAKENLEDNGDIWKSYIEIDTTLDSTLTTPKYSTNISIFKEPIIKSIEQSDLSIKLNNLSINQSDLLKDQSLQENILASSDITINNHTDVSEQKNESSDHMTASDTSVNTHTDLSQPKNGLLDERKQKIETNFDNINFNKSYYNQISPTNMYVVDDYMNRINNEIDTDDDDIFNDKRLNNLKIGSNDSYKDCKVNNLIDNLLDITKDITMNTEVDGKIDESKEDIIKEEKLKLKSITKYYTGILNSIIKCTKCNKESITTENYYTISLSIPITKHMITLYDCLNTFIKPEYLLINQSNGYKCNNCNELTNAIKYMIPSNKLPRCLCIHLKRLLYNNKNNNYIDFPIDLDLTDFIDLKHIKHHHHHHHHHRSAISDSIIDKEQPSDINMKDNDIENSKSDEINENNIAIESNTTNIEVDYNEIDVNEKTNENEIDKDINDNETNYNTNNKETNNNDDVDIKHKESNNEKDTNDRNHHHHRRKSHSNSDSNDVSSHHHHHHHHKKHLSHEIEENDFIKEHHHPHHIHTSINSSNSNSNHDSLDKPNDNKSLFHNPNDMNQLEKEKIKQKSIEILNSVNEIDINDININNNHSQSSHRYNYTLVSVIVHQGSHQGGHYISYVLYKNQWYYISDSNVVKCNENDVKKCNAYMLFYIRS